jgi:hypothetical protein
VRVRFVTENVHGVVSDLQKVDVSGDRARRPTRRKLDAVSTFKFGDLVFGMGKRSRVLYEGGAAGSGMKRGFR